MRPHLYRCCEAAITYGEKLCMSVEGRTLDEAIERLVLQVLASPPIEMLKEALIAATRNEDIRGRELAAERQRIEHRERLVRSQFDACDPKYELVYTDLQQQLNAVLLEKKRFEERVRLERERPRLQMTEETLMRLCELASKVPEIWKHRLVTHEDRKRIIRCVIKKITVAITQETFEVDLKWNSGARTQFRLYRWQHRRNLVKELHAEGYASREILARLWAGKTSTGQKMELHPESLNRIYSELGLKRNRIPTWYTSLGLRAIELHDQGRTWQQICEVFNEEGIKSLSGQHWTRKLVHNMISTIRRSPDVKKIHREAFVEARALGLNYGETAKYFNERRVPRRSKRPWTPAAVRGRWWSLKGTILKD